jgi:hypothetical protein
MLTLVTKERDTLANQVRQPHLLALLVQKYKYWRRKRRDTLTNQVRQPRITFTGIKVQILTHLLAQKYTYWRIWRTSKAECAWDGEGSARQRTRHACQNAQCPWSQVLCCYKSNLRTVLYCYKSTWENDTLAKTRNVLEVRCFTATKALASLVPKYTYLRRRLGFRGSQLETEKEALESNARYLLYWYKSTHTDAESSDSGAHSLRRRRRRLRVMQDSILIA